MAHFKRHREELKTGVYKGGPYATDAKRGRKLIGGLRLACPDNQELTAAQWTEAVIDAYSNVNSVEQMLDAIFVRPVSVEAIANPPPPTRRQRIVGTRYDSPFGSRSRQSSFLSNALAAPPFLP